MNRKVIVEDMMQKFDKLTPAQRKIVGALAAELLTAEFRSARRAIENATLDDVAAGADALEIAFEDAFRMEPRMIAGLAYIAGIARGKQLDRKRRRRTT